MDFDKYYTFILGLPKTIYINFKYFKFKDAIKLPIFVSKRVRLSKLQGKITVPVKTGMIQIGFGDIGIFDKYKSKSILKLSNNSLITFNGRAKIGLGSKICSSGNLIFGDNFSISAETEIICNKKIEFGNDCLLSWDILVMDSDQHSIKTIDGRIVNEDQEISIGNNVWVGCRSTILKGTVIKDNNVIASNTTLCGKHDFINSVIGGTPNKVLKSNIYWEK